MSVSPGARLRHVLQGYFVRWASRRAKNATQYTLHRKNLYIFPTLTGSAFLLLALVIWLLGTNYQNNLILALSYMQISLFVIIILNTYNNLSGINVSINGVRNVCVSEPVDFEFTVSSPNSEGTHYVTLGWRLPSKVFKKHNSKFFRLFDFEAKRDHSIKVSAQSIQRGYLQPKHLLLESTFPMGLLKCWTWLYFDMKALVYPAPVPCPLPKNTVGSEDQEEGCAQAVTEGDDFVGFTQYQAGDSPKHIAWALYAREQGLHRKQYGAPEAIHAWLNWADFFYGDVELCLSNMCYWAKQFNQQGQTFGLVLPTTEIALGEGEAHLHSVLSALALFDTPT